jgi:hypothetical protein
MCGPEGRGFKVCVRARESVYVVALATEVPVLLLPLNL